MDRNYAGHSYTARLHAGFTLIEMVIVVVIIAVLAGIALPSYQGSVRKGQRSDAKARRQICHHLPAQQNRSGYS